MQFTTYAVKWNEPRPFSHYTQTSHTLFHVRAKGGKKARTNIL